MVFITQIALSKHFNSHRKRSVLLKSDNWNIKTGALYVWEYARGLILLHQNCKLTYNTHVKNWCSQDGKSPTHTLSYIIIYIRIALSIHFVKTTVLVVSLLEFGLNLCGKTKKDIEKICLCRNLIWPLIFVMLYVWVSCGYIKEIRIYKLIDEDSKKHFVNMRAFRSIFVLRRGFSTSNSVQNSYKFVVAGGGAGGIGSAAALKRIYGRDASVAIIEPSQVGVCLACLHDLFTCSARSCLCIWSFWCLFSFVLKVMIGRGSWSCCFMQHLYVMFIFKQCLFWVLLFSIRC